MCTGVILASIAGCSDFSLCSSAGFQSFSLGAGSLSRHSRLSLLLQEWGYQAWNLAGSSPITLKIIKSATDSAVARLDKNFFRLRFDRCTPSEKSFLRAMAELDPAPQRTGDIAGVLGVKAPIA